LKIHGAANGSFAMAVSSLAYQCAATAIDYGRIFNLIDLDSASYNERLFIYLEGAIYKATSNPCVEGLTASSVDHSLALQAINADATRASFRALFISQKLEIPKFCSLIIKVIISAFLILVEIRCFKISNRSATG
jgi:hypothetical protein